MVGSAGLAFACLVGFYQVVTRFILHSPSSWSEPLTQTTLIWMTYVALAGAMRTGTLISVDLLLSISVGRLQTLIRLLTIASVMALLVILLWFGCEIVWRVRYQTIAGLGVSASWAYLALPVGSVLSMLALIAHAIDPDKAGDHRIENAG